MKVIYIDASMGAAGDMLTGALYGLLSEEEKRKFLEKTEKLLPQGTVLNINETVKQGISGYRAHVTINGITEGEEDHHHHEDHHHEDHHHEDHHHEDHHHENHRDHNKDHHGESHDHNHGKHNHGADESHQYGHENQSHSGESHTHRTLKDIEKIMKSVGISESVFQNASSVYRIIAEAEGRVHGEKPDLIHFHEVGELDAVADIVSVCLLMEMISPERIVSSPVNLGSGTVKCAHGILPVPAPATALITEGMKVYSSGIKSELLTPTGAALLKFFVEEYSEMPVMEITSSSFGFGKKEFARINAVRILLGEVKEEKEEKKDIFSGGIYEDTAVLLSANIDDMTAENIAAVTEELLSLGCYDVYLEQIIMKKGRPGVVLNALVKGDMVRKTAEFILSSTTTLGVRYSPYKRYCLERREEVIYKDGIKIRVKYSGEGKSGKFKAEHEDIKEYARIKNISTEKALKEINSHIMYEKGK